MKQCTDYEVELSALLDGESNPAMALRLVEHVASCSSCGSFVGELRFTQDFIDNLPAVVEPEPATVVIGPMKRKRPRVLRLAPHWAIGIAALLIVTVSLWFGADIGSPSGLTNDLRDGELVIHLEEDRGRMSDQRFVALVSELLRADRRYQNQMYVVLNEITKPRAFGESRIYYNSHESGNNDDSERGESFSPSTAQLK